MASARSVFHLEDEEAGQHVLQAADGGLDLGDVALEPHDARLQLEPRVLGVEHAEDVDRLQQLGATVRLDLVAHGIDGRILEVLCGAEAAFTGRQVHALVHHGSPAGVQLGLDRLRRQGLVTAEPAGRAILYRLNGSHLAAPYLCTLVDLRRELLERLRSEFEGWDPRPLAAYVFGSTARRESGVDSDVDLCVVLPLDVDADAPAWRDQVDRLSRMVTAWTGNEARVVEFSEDEVRSAVGRDRLLASIRAEGIQVAGDASVLRASPTEPRSCGSSPAPPPPSRAASPGRSSSSRRPRTNVDTIRSASTRGSPTPSSRASRRPT